MDGSDADHDHDALDGDSISMQLRHICLEYSYRQLEAATENFSKTHQLGEGSAGTVFKGEMQDGSYAAVKVIDLSTIGDMAAVAGFEDEIAILSKFRHPNLVVLMGWAKEGSRRFLVYEYLSGGDVSGRLHKTRSGQRQWLWHERMAVLREAAQGLAHLHNAKPHAFHRDVKTANILLTNDGGAKVADFGLACVAKQKRASTVRCKFPSGTPGYTCPAYATSGKMTESSEAFSFGVVILEVLLNKMPAGMLNGELMYPLADAVQPAAPGAIDRCIAMADPSGAWPPPVAAEVAALGLSCLDPNLAQRPTFNEICKRLRALQAQFPPMPPQMAPGPPWPPAHGGHATPGAPPPGAPFHTMGPPGPHFHPGMPPPPPGMMWQQAPPPGPGPPAAYPSGVIMMHGPPPPRVPGPGHHPMPPPPTAAPPAPSHVPGQNPPEVALEVAHVRIGSVNNINPAYRVLPCYPCVDREGRKLVPIGRQHQPQWFEAILQDAGDLSCISRNVFEFVWGGPDPNTRELSMRVLSKHPILVDDVAVPYNEWAPVHHGSKVALTGQVETGGRLVLIVFVVHCAPTARQPRGAGPRLPAPMPCGAPGGPQQQGQLQQIPVAVEPIPNGPGLPQAAWRLDCMYASGLSADAFWALPASVRSINFELAMDCPYIVIGRTHQRELFEALLANDKPTLTYVSRSHFKFEFIDGQEPPELGHVVSVLQVTNMSQNVAAIGGHPLRQGESTIARDGDTIGFLTPPPVPEDGSADMQESSQAGMADASRTRAASRGSSKQPNLDAQDEAPGAPFLTFRLVGPQPPQPPPWAEQPPAIPGSSPPEGLAAAAPTRGLARAEEDDLDMHGSVAKELHMQEQMSGKDRRPPEPSQARLSEMQSAKKPVAAMTVPRHTPANGGNGDNGLRSNSLSRPHTQHGSTAKGTKDKHQQQQQCAVM